MSRLATQELYFGGHMSSEQILAGIDAVDIEALERLSKNVLLNGMRGASVAVVGPPAPDYYNVPMIEELLARFN